MEAELCTSAQKAEFLLKKLGNTDGARLWRSVNFHDLTWAFGPG